MPQYSLDGDTSGLPKTRRSAIPYEIEALSPREMWGHGNGATSLVCKQEWDRATDWIKDMVGEVSVIKPGSSLLLNRYVPEPLRYGEIGPGADSRVQFCSSVDQVSQGGNEEGGNFAQAVTNWPATDWAKYRATFEAYPYAILHATESVCGLPSMAEIQAGAGAYAGAIELYRYVVRSRRSYSREMTVPGPNVAANKGFYVVDDVTAENRKLVPGGMAFHIVSLADVTYKWVRVPVGWPPPIGWTAPAPPNHWPPRFNPAAGGAGPTSLKRARDTYQGTINSDWFDCAAADGYCFPPGTLLYTGYDDSNRYYDAAGDWVCDITFNFKYKGGTDSAGNIGGWNHYLSSNLVWTSVTSGTVPPAGTAGTSSGTPPYKSNNFNNLFQAA